MEKASILITLCSAGHACFSALELEEAFYIGQLSNGHIMLARVYLGLSLSLIGLITLHQHMEFFIGVLLDGLYTPFQQLQLLFHFIDIISAHFG